MAEPFSGLDAQREVVRLASELRGLAGNEMLSKACLQEHVKRITDAISSAPSGGYMDKNEREIAMARLDLLIRPDREREKDQEVFFATVLKALMDDLHRRQTREES